jgi:hypothetical protein
MKEEILKDLKEVIIPAVVAEVIHRLNQTEEELDRIISHQVAEKSYIIVMTNLTQLPPPFSSVPPCICPIETGISCVSWGAKEWLVTSTLCSSALGVFLAVSAHLLKKHYNKPKVAPRIQTNQSTIDEIMVMQR